jgi:cytochrome c-type biogenesis protein CcmE
MADPTNGPLPGAPSNKRKAKFIAGGGAIALVLVALIGYALTRPGSTSFYLTASEVSAQGATAPGQEVRVNGRVVDGSIVQDGLTTTFTISDGKVDLEVTTAQPLPSAFKAGADVVAHGYYDGTTFNADDVVAKCPSKFKPAA